MSCKVYIFESISWAASGPLLLWPKPGVGRLEYIQSIFVEYKDFVFDDAARSRHRDDAQMREKEDEPGEFRNEDTQFYPTNSNIEWTRDHWQRRLVYAFDCDVDKEDDGYKEWVLCEIHRELLGKCYGDCRQSESIFRWSLVCLRLETVTFFDNIVMTYV